MAEPLKPVNKMAYFKLCPPLFIEAVEPTITPGSRGYESWTMRWAGGRPASTCDVYWGSHGCGRKPNHGGGHRCDCCRFPRLHFILHRKTGCVGARPYYGKETFFYGDDAK